MNNEEIGIPPGTLRFVKDEHGEIVLRRIFEGKEIPMTWEAYKKWKIEQHDK